MAYPDGRRLACRFQGPREGEHVLALAALLSVLMGIALGVFGGGGSILTVPILVYVLGMGAKEAIALSLLVVGATSTWAQ